MVFECSYKGKKQKTQKKPKLIFSPYMLHHPNCTNFEECFFLKFGRRWSEVAGVAGYACRIIRLDDLAHFDKKNFLVS